MDGDEKTMIDRAHLAEMTGDDPEFETELMQEFVSSVPELIRQLEAAIASSDARALEISAHTLKGSCRSLGAMMLSDPCEELETIARAGSTEGAATIFSGVQELYHRTLEYVTQEWNLKAA